MKVSYRREMKHNYMIIDPEEITWRSYECQMMESNVIEGLLRFQPRLSNGEMQFFYEITSRQPLERLLENRTISGEEIRRLIIGISNILDQIERFLLDESSILLKPYYIYVEPDSFRIWLCLVPGLKLNFPEAYGALLEYILGKVNHQDKDSVVLAYGLYQETRKENYGMEDILRLLQKNSFSEFSESRNTDVQGDDEVGKEREKTGKYRGKPETVPIKKSENNQHLFGQASPEDKNIWSRIKAFFMGHRRKKQEVESNQLPWQVMFMDESEEVEARVFSTSPNGGVSDAAPFPKAALHPSSLQPLSPTAILPSPMLEPAESSLPAAASAPASHLPSSDFMPTGQGTVLLSDIAPKETSRKLRALDSGETDIMLSYYPFVIGKQENLADYILNRETVSRLHLRIDRVDEEYQIMDLNSTNGTAVRGTMLENNESVPLHPGDEVQIAKYRYRFE